MRKFIANENDNNGFTFTAASDEQLAKANEMKKELVFKGGRKDVDKRVEDMTEEEKAVFECLEDDVNVFAGAYEELGDDFLDMLNGGQPALELIGEAPKPEHDNAGVIVVEDEGPPTEHPMMIENYKEKMADVIAMLAKQQEIREEAVAKGLKPKEVET